MKNVHGCEAWSKKTGYSMKRAREAHTFDLEVTQRPEQHEQICL